MSILKIFNKRVPNDVQNGFVVVLFLAALCIAVLARLFNGWMIFGALVVSLSLCGWAIFKETSKYFSGDFSKLWNEIENLCSNDKMFIKNLSREEVNLKDSSYYRYSYEAILVGEKYLYTFVSYKGKLSVKKINKETSQVENDSVLNTYSRHLNAIFIKSKASEILNDDLQLHQNESKFIEEISQLINEKENYIKNTVVANKIKASV